jgi:hypothetical protein
MSPFQNVARRAFLKLSASAAAAFSQPVAMLGAQRSVQIVFDPADAVASASAAQWGAQHLCAALTERGVDATVVRALDRQKSPGRIVFLSGPASVPTGFAAAKTTAVHAESVRMVSGQTQNIPATWISSPGALGLVYGLTDLAERVRTSVDPLAAIHLSVPVEEAPANEVRSVARAFCSEVEDKPWFYSKPFWTGYLDALAAGRFNRFNFAFGFGYDFPKGVTEDYFHFPYPYLVTVPGYDVRVVPLADGERERNMQIFRYIVAETAARGLQFQLGLWTHAYEWTDSPKSYHHIEGLNAKNHAAYCRDALAILLRECPQITGITMRVHGESGVPEGSYDFWRTLFEAIKNCGRRVEIDMHAKGINQIMIDMANDTGMPVKIGAKSWAEHMGLGYHQADIRELEIPRADRMETGVFAVSNGERRFTRYGYADLLQEGRKYNVLFRLWPGTQRHLLWGDPETAAAYSRTAHFCGAAGLEICEPLTFKGREGSGHAGGRNSYLDASLEPTADWEKFAYTYRIWGRMLYNPNTPADVWHRPLVHQFGPGATGAESALANASRVLPLITTAHLPSASNHSFWPELYTNMPIVPGQHSPYTDTPKPYRFGTVGPLDPQIFSSIEEFVSESLKGQASPKYSPLTVAVWLDKFTSTATQSLAQFRQAAKGKSTPEFRRWEEDILIQIGLGRFFSAKMQSAVAFEIFLNTGDKAAARTAVAKYTQARDAWATMAKRAATVYKPDLGYGEIPGRRGHWSDRLPAIESDLVLMKEAIAKPPASTGPSVTPGKIATMISATPARPIFHARHTPATAFSPGQALDISLQADNAAGAEIFYRHVNQGERWKSASMRKQGSTYTSTIPAEYTQSVYPLQYYFVLHRGDTAGYHPEFNATLSNEPYYSVWHRS